MALVETQGLGEGLVFCVLTSLITTVSFGKFIAVCALSSLLGLLCRRAVLSLSLSELFFPFLALLPLLGSSFPSLIEDLSRAPSASTASTGLATHRRIRTYVQQKLPPTPRGSRRFARQSFPSFVTLLSLCNTNYSTPSNGSTQDAMASGSSGF